MTSPRNPSRDIEPPPAVSRRMQFTPPAEFVERYLDALQRGRIDLDDAQHRRKLQQWMVRILDDYLRCLEWELGKAADRGVRQALLLMRDPDYYAQRHRRHQQDRARNEQQMAESHQRWLEEQAAEQAEREQLEAEGKLASINRPRAVKPRPPPQEPEPPAS